MYIEFEDNMKFPKKNADISDTPDPFKDAGYIIEENDLVIDIDNIEKSVIEKIISLYNIKTETVWTDRGAHFYYKKPQGFKGSKKVCPLGFEVEYKHIKNTHSVCVKRENKMRIIENDGVREDLPDIFYIRSKLDSLLGIDDGEGRNRALFSHRMKIHHLDGWTSILRFINNNIFATPLTEDEFQTISRKGIKIEGKKDSEPENAEILLSKYKMVLYNGQLYFYDNNRFIVNHDKLRRMIFDEVGRQKTRYIEEIIKQMEFRADLIEPDIPFDIKFKNGILREGQFFEIDYQGFTPYSIPLNYNPDAKPIPIVDEYLDFLTDNDSEYKNLILESFAHIFITNPEFKRLLGKFFIFIGSGGNGKGTLLTIIRKIIGRENCSSLSIKELTKEQYFYSMQNKLVNLGDDIEDMPINHDQLKQLKNISTCDFVSMRQLFKQSANVVLTTSLIFTSNHLLKSFEKNEAYRRRVIWCPMFGVPTKKDPRFIEKLTTNEALEYWLKLIIDGYFRLYKNSSFSESERVAQYNAEYHDVNNPCLTFIRDYEQEYYIGRRPPEIYDQYKIWAEENEGENAAVSERIFRDTLRKEKNLVIKVKWINKKSARMYDKL